MPDRGIKDITSCIVAGILEQLIDVDEAVHLSHLFGNAISAIFDPARNRGIDRRSVHDHSTWQETRVLLGGLSSAEGWQNLFTDEMQLASELEGQSALKAADIFGHFPVALLIADKNATISTARHGA
jgi:hypothetical protein